MIDACMHTCGVRRTGQTTLFVLKVVQTKQPTQIAVQATPLDWTHRSKEEALGVLVSKICFETPAEIYEVVTSAFEDSNFHTFNAKFEELWKKEVSK